MANRYASREDRFWSKVDRTEDCWNWTASTWKKGYGQFNDDTRRLLAHRVSYELLAGPIPADMTLDHLCLNKRCVNPDHLEPVSRGENARRYAATIEACPSGHPYDSANTYTDTRGRRSCRQCHRIREYARTQSPEQKARKAAKQRERRRLAREAALAPVAPAAEPPSCICAVPLAIGNEKCDRCGGPQS